MRRWALPTRYMLRRITASITKDLIFGFCGKYLLVLHVALASIGEVTRSVAFLTNSRLEIENYLLICSCSDVAWKFQLMLVVNVDMKHYHPAIVASYGGI